jgi:hypothetical protein
MKIQSYNNSLHTYIVLNTYRNETHAYLAIIVHEDGVQLADSNIYVTYEN